MVIGIILIAALFLYLKVDHQGRKIKMILLIFLVAVLLLSLTVVLSSSNIDLKSPRGIIQAVYFYVGWVGKTTANLWNIGTDFTGKVIDAVKMNSTDVNENYPPR